MSFDFNKVKSRRIEDEYQIWDEEFAEKEENQISIKPITTTLGFNEREYLISAEAYKTKGYMDAVTEDAFLGKDFCELFFECFSFSESDSDEFTKEEQELIRHLSFSKDKRLTLDVPYGKNVDKYIDNCANVVVCAIKKTLQYKILFNEKWEEYGCECESSRLVAKIAAHLKGEPEPSFIDQLSPLEQLQYKDYVEGTEIYVFSENKKPIALDSKVFRGIYHLEGDDGNYKLVRHSTRHYLRKE
jgi:hypothetical protein